MIIAVAIYLKPQSDSSNDLDSNGLTASQKTIAINIALGDPSIKNWLSAHPGGSRIGSVKILGTDGESGFVNLSDTIVEVPFQFLDSISFINNERVNISVDLNTSKVIGNIWYSYRNFPMDADITIPPGSYWYYQLSGGIAMNSPIAEQGTLTMSPWVYDIQPENASIYPTILDEENLRLFLNGTLYHALEYYDNDTKSNTSIDGNTPFSHNWSTQISIPLYQATDGTSQPNYKIPTHYYVLLKNSDPDQYISISFRCGPF